MKKFPKSQFLGNRDAYLSRICKGKRVVHIGCTDWPNQLDQIRSSSLLHFKLATVSSSLLGVDVDRDGIFHLESLNPNLSYVVGDIMVSMEIRRAIINFAPELILVPDVLEHIEDQRVFLRALQEINQSARAKIILTTPNAFSLKTFLPSILGLDFTHSDHCLMHNEFTLQHVLNDADLKNHQIHYAVRDIAGRYGKWAQWVSKPIDYLCRFAARFSDSLLVEISC